MTNETNQRLTIRPANSNDNSLEFEAADDNGVVQLDVLIQGAYCEQGQHTLYLSRFDTITLINFLQKQVEH